MKSNIRYAFAIVLAAALMIAPADRACLGQSQPVFGNAPKGPGGVSGVAIDLDFGGGNAVEYVDAIRKASGGKVNIVTMPHVEDVQMPSMKLRSVDVFGAVSLLDGETHQSETSVVRLDVAVIGMMGADAGTVYKVDAEVKAVAAQGPQRSNIWSVADLINGGMSPDSIVTAVSAALELLGPDSSKAQVRFHKETSLLLARATVEQIEIINSVISELRASSAQQRAQSMKPIQERVAQLERELAESRSMLKAREVEANDRLQIAEMSRARAEAMERHAAELEAVTSRLRDELMQRESQMRAIQIELDEMRTQLQKSRGGGGG